MTIGKMAIFSRESLREGLSSQLLLSTFPVDREVIGSILEGGFGWHDMSCTIEGVNTA